MAATTNPQQYSILDQLGALLGIGDSGTTGAMTVPTALNTSNNWTPPNTALSKSTGTGLGFNTETGGLALQGLSSLAGLWGAMNQNKLAKDQFNFQKDFANTNLNNQIQSYNTTLDDRLTSRGFTEGRSDDYTRDKINQNLLSR